MSPKKVEKQESNFILNMPDDENMAQSSQMESFPQFPTD